MEFDPDNNIVKLCANGMVLEGEGKPNEAYNLFKKAWDEATNDFEKFVAAHYVARHQKTVSDKLVWDKTALDFALKTDRQDVKESYPSLYLNIAKCYEDLGDDGNALLNYNNARFFQDLLPDDGYGNMIRRGIQKGMERVNARQ